MSKDKEIIEKALKAFRRAVDASKENYDAAKEDIEFVYVEQWDKNARKSREKDGRPCLTINRLPTYIRQVVNEAKKNKVAIKVLPRDSKSDIKTAEVFADIIRSIEYGSNAEHVYMSAFESAVTCGIGFWRISTGYKHNDPFNLEIFVERIADPLSVFMDPGSNAVDGSDSNYAFVITTMTEDEFKRAYPGAKTDKDSFDLLDNFGDYDLYSEGDTGKGKTIKVLEYWYREAVKKTAFLMSDGSIIDQDVYSERYGDLVAVGIKPVKEKEYDTYIVKQKIMTGAEILHEEDFPGAFIPIVPVYGEEVRHDGKKLLFSLIRNAKDSQKSLNINRTSSAEYAANAPMNMMVATMGSIANQGQVEKMDGANLKVLYIEEGHNPPIVLPPPSPPVALLSEAANAIDEIKGVTGSYDASMGNASNEISGRAILARQQQSNTSTFHFHDNLHKAIRFTGEILAGIIPKVYEMGRILRILGEEGEVEGVVEVGNSFAPQEPKIPEGVKEIYDLAVGNYDVIVKAGASSTSKRELAVEQLLDLAKLDPQSARLFADVIVNNMDIKDADEIVKRIKAMLPPEVKSIIDEENPESKMAQMQVEQIKKQAQQIGQQMQQQIGQLQAENQQLKQSQQIDAGKLKIDEFNAETNRMKAMDSTITPESIQPIVAQAVLQTLQALSAAQSGQVEVPPTNQ